MLVDPLRDRDAVVPGNLRELRFRRRVRGIGSRTCAADRGCGGSSQRRPSSRQRHAAKAARLWIPTAAPVNVDQAVCEVDVGRRQVEGHIDPNPGPNQHGYERAQLFSASAQRLLDLACRLKPREVPLSNVKRRDEPERALHARRLGTARRQPPEEGTALITHLVTRCSSSAVFAGPRVAKAPTQTLTLFPQTARARKPDTFRHHPDRAPRSLHRASDSRG